MKQPCFKKPAWIYIPFLAMDAVIALMIIVLVYVYISIALTGYSVSHHLYEMFLYTGCIEL